jgi:hypothetical protein
MLLPSLLASPSRAGQLVSNVRASLHHNNDLSGLADLSAGYGLIALPLRELFSPSRPWAILFTPPTHRLLRNRLPGTRPFPKRAPPYKYFFQAGSWSVLISLARVTPCALRGVQDPVAAVAFSPAQPCARQDVRFSQGRWRDAVFEVPFRPSSRTEQVCGAKRRQGHAVTPSLKQWLPGQALSSAGVRVRRARESNSPYALSFCGGFGASTRDQGPTLIS